MTNTMDINFVRENNSMNSLNFYWIAEFENDCIFQFENKIEHKYQEVKDRIHNLKYFTLQHKNKELAFVVDLINGTITFNKKCPLKIDSDKKNNIRLIFFRRHKVEITEKMMEKSHTIEYHLGFQYNNKLGNNRQIILQIDNEGNFIIED